MSMVTAQTEESTDGALTEDSTHSQSSSVDDKLGKGVVGSIINSQTDHTSRHQDCLICKNPKRPFIKL